MQRILESDEYTKNILNPSINFINNSIFQTMKKLVLFLAVATAVAFASCGNKEAKTEEAAEEVPAVEAVVETPAVADSVVVDSAAVEAPVEAAPAEVVAE